MKFIKTGLKTSTSLPYRSPLAGYFLVVAILLLPGLSYAQDSSKKTYPDGTDGAILKVGPDNYTEKKLKPNEFEGTYSTIRVGLGYIMDAATYSEDAVFKKQMDSAGLSLDSKIETRDFRILASGVFKTKKSLSWKVGFMYDGDKKTWLLRETGFTIGVPKLWGHIFIGRTKEGYSMVKVMNGHSPWGAERQMALDVIPILADGVKWFGFMPKSRVFWNLGYFNDILSKGQSFSTYAWQYDARVGWMPVYNKEKQKVLHLAVNLRYGKPVNGQIVLKSRPESNPAPQIINTGTFSSDYSTHIGGELYYSTGRFLIGSEVMVHKFNASSPGDLNFFGGDIIATYIFTKTRRPYNTMGSVFGFVVPVTKSVFKGGWGEWEAVLKYSTLDLEDGNIHGGKFWRITPMVNWYMTKVMRMEFIYGYGVLDRYNLKGTMQVFQARVQFTVM